ncbi:MAG: hypothetical protein G01um10148_211 [Parcubacteria group bacterium Gr01-1014_8]|nr:MAG: hypothetical protein G01um10148_211 [Parcubacteria group bacterium Gr01-1014_8]
MIRINASLAEHSGRQRSKHQDSQLIESMTNAFFGRPREPDRAEQPLSHEDMVRIASQLHHDAILSPKRFDDAADARLRVVKAFANLAIQTKEYLNTSCDTLIIDQKSGNLPGLFFKQLTADIYRNTGKVAPAIHDIVASLRLPDRVNVLETYFRDAFENQLIGDHILIVTEHAISRSSAGLVTFADMIKRIGAEFGKEPEIRFAAVSVGREFPTRAQRADKGLENLYQWYAGELGYSIGSMAFHRANVNDLAYMEGSARPRIVPSSEAGPDAEAAKADMIMLARELAPLVLGKKST